MRRDWRKATLGEFAPFTYGKSLPAHRRNASGQVPVFGSNGVVGYHDAALTDGPTIIIGRKGTAGAVHYSPVPCWPIDTTFFFTDGDAELTRFKYYALRTLGLDDMNTDSAVPGLNRNAAHARELSVPEESDQRRIAQILGALDDKIELNRRINATLEGMARALFKSWFIDFDPVRAKMQGRWRRGESLPGMPFFQGRADFGFRYPENRRYCTAPTRLAQPDDTLVSVRAPVGSINMAWVRCCIGRGLAVLRHKSGSASYTYHAIWSIQRQLQEYEHTGTVFGAINKGQFEELRVIEPTSKIVDLFATIALQWDKRIRQNVAESRRLAEMRDALLPGLVSGQPMHK